MQASTFLRPGFDSTAISERSLTGIDVLRRMLGQIFKEVVLLKQMEPNSTIAFDLLRLANLGFDIRATEPSEFINAIRRLAGQTTATSDDYKDLALTQLHHPNNNDGFLQKLALKGTGYAESPAAGPQPSSGPTSTSTAPVARSDPNSGLPGLLPAGSKRTSPESSAPGEKPEEAIVVSEGEEEPPDTLAHENVQKEIVDCLKAMYADIGKACGANFQRTPRQRYLPPSQTNLQEPTAGLPQGSRRRVQLSELRALRMSIAEGRLLKSLNDHSA